ncbi:MAG: class I SAM-dependent methyltransferase [Candidatus Methanoperedenaceae archaeon]|nr:class I SAM-dependent methyltransferase [Candidatus Methanoperedenaceae archaeon]
MKKTASNLGFKLMALTFNLRDLLRPRINILKEAGIKPGHHVLDYGCGSGSYIMDTARLVGGSGMVYALDIHPLAIQLVHNLASKKKLMNVTTIHSDCRTGLPDKSLDVVLMYDAFHDLEKPDDILKEIHRVLRSDGILSFSDHHMKEEEIASKVTKNGWFRLLRKGERTDSFLKEE